MFYSIIPSIPVFPDKLKNKSPRGLNAHLNLMNSHLTQAPCGGTRGMSSIRKTLKTLLDLLNLLFLFQQLIIPLPYGWFRTMKFGEILTTLFWEGHDNVTFPFGPPPPPWGHHGHCKKCFYSSPMYNRFRKQDYLTVLLLELEKRMCTIWRTFNPWSLRTIPAVWLKSDHAFSRRWWNSYFLHWAPPPPPPNPLPPLRGPIGATLGGCHEQLYSSPKKASTH